MKLTSIAKVILSEQKFEYGCAMLNFNFPEDIVRVQKLIPENHLYTEKGDRTFGLETEPHLTLLYGLHKEVTLKEVKDIISRFTFTPLSLENVSTFNNAKYDVLKMDVVNPILNKVNTALCTLPYTTEFPDYHPHCTIAYLKKGHAVHYIQMLKGHVYKVIPTHAVFSQPNGKITKITIN